VSDWLEEALGYNEARADAGELGGEDIANVGLALQILADLKDKSGKVGPLTVRKAEEVVKAHFAATGAYAGAFTGWVHCLGSVDGVLPYMSSGYVDHDGNGPNQARYKSGVKRGLRYPGHLGCDFVYRWNHRGPRPPTLFEKHFYCPPVPVYAMGPGKVVYAKLLDVHEQYGGDRWAINIYHGELPGFGHCNTWSVHHREVHVKAGDWVEAGQVIATAGDTGAPGAPHVHQEIWQWQTGEFFRRHTDTVDPAPIIANFRIIENS
jgi:hypothetical protein